MANTSLLGSYGGIDGSALMFRNRIINGDMRIDQRNAGNAQTITAAASAVYCVDRWQAFCTGANITAQRVSGSSGNQYALRFTGLASNTATELAQRIESTNCYDLANKDVTVSFRVSSTSITTLTWIVDSSNGGADAWSGATQIATGTITISSTDTAYSFTFNAGATAINGMRIRIQTGALLASQTITFQQFQLEAGAVATPFERRPIGTELALCQRYYWRVNDKGAGTDVLMGLSMGSSTNAALFTVNLPVTMRTAPSIDGSCVVANANASIVNPSVSFAQILSQNSFASTSIVCLNSSLTANTPYRVLLNTVGHFFSANAEL